MSTSVLRLLGQRCISAMSTGNFMAASCPMPSMSGSILSVATSAIAQVDGFFGEAARCSDRRYKSSTSASSYVGLGNLRDNPGATRQRIRVGRGDAARRGNYCGRGLKGQKARSGSGPHPLYDGGQLGLLKFPVSREKPSYEVLYKQLGLPRLIEYVQLGLLDPTKVITMKDLFDTGCVGGNIRYGVQLYGKPASKFKIPLHIQVTACTDETRAAIEATGGSLQRVYYTAEGIHALIHPSVYKSKNLPLPPPAHSWHPRYNGKFDAIGQLPPSKLPLPVSMKDGSASLLPLHLGSTLFGGSSSASVPAGMQ